MRAKLGFASAAESQSCASQSGGEVIEVKVEADT